MGQYGAEVLTPMDGFASKNVESAELLPAAGAPSPQTLLLRHMQLAGPLPAHGGLVVEHFALEDSGTRIYLISQSVLLFS